MGYVKYVTRIASNRNFYCSSHYINDSLDHGPLTEIVRQANFHLFCDQNDDNVITQPVVREVENTIAILNGVNSF